MFIAAPTDLGETENGDEGLDEGGTEVVVDLIWVNNTVNVMTVAVNKRLMVMHPEMTIDLVVHLQD